MRRAVLCGFVIAALSAAAAPAIAAPFAPLDRPGPKLRAGIEQLRSSLRCSDGIRDARRTPVLLLPATTVNSEQNFGWNHERLLAAEEIPYCTSDQPGERNSNMTDIQTRAEFVTYAIRRVYGIAGRRISIIGHSQGGMAMRFPLRFWPDTRRMVDDVIGFAATNHGSDAIRYLCSPDCSPALWQQLAGSDFVTAMNSRRQAFPEISYTEVYSRTDEFVTPPARASSLAGPGRISNVAIQEICPLALSEHLLIGTTDPIAAALALDALGHRGPADPGRIDRSVCNEVLMGGVDPVGGPIGLADAARALATALALFPHSASEPQLRCWVFKDRRRCRVKRRAAAAG